MRLSSSSLNIEFCHLLLHLGKPIKAEQKDQNEEVQQSDTLPRIEEPWSTSLLELLYL